ncbi:MAG: FKBP-type peptidyl-prolyl cis-trans isomerase [Pseudomonadota bacterium]
MIRTFILGLALGLTLVACSGGSSEPVDPADPFAVLAPWDSQRDDIVTTASGLQYYVLRSGDASQQRLKETDTVIAEYDMRFESDGARWDSSEERHGFAAIFRVPDRLPGWTEALQLMRPGDEWMIYTPANLAFGEESPPGIPQGSAFVTRMKVISAKSGDYPGTAHWDTYTLWDPEADGVITTDSGLQYVVLKSGSDGGVAPKINDVAVVHYEGRFAESGEVFDNSFARGSPGNFRVSQIIPGWTEALQLMKPGDEWLLYIPADLAYGESGRPGVPPNADLIFHVDLFGSIPDDYPGNEIWEANWPWNPDADGVEVTESGIEYIELTSAPEGETKPKPGDTVVVDYDGRLSSNGARFDGTFDGATPLTIEVGRVIPAWTEMLQLMDPGDDWLVHIPSELGYGEEGTPGGPIPPNADLMFRIKLNEFFGKQVSDTEAWDRLTPWNSEADGVQKTASGLEYVVIESGPEDGQSPTPNSRAVVYYEGRLAETGATFDSAYERGRYAEFGVTQVIPGWTEALQLMKPGDRWMLYLPANIAYGEREAGSIPANSDLIFEVQLMAVQ